MSEFDLDPFADEMAALGAPEHEHEHHCRPTLVQWSKGIRHDEKGLWFDPGGDKTPVHLTGPFTVLSEARDPNSDGWSVALEWLDRDGKVHRHFVPKGDLLGDGHEVLKPLVSGGLELSPDTNRL